MKKAAWEIAACAAVLILFCVVCRFTFLNTYTAYVPLTASKEESLRRGGVSMVSDEPRVLHGEAEIRNGYLRMDVHPDQPGDTFLYFKDQDGETVDSLFLRVDRFMTVYDMGSGGFTIS